MPIIQIQETETAEQFISRMGDLQLKAEFLIAKNKYEQTGDIEALAASVFMSDELFSRDLLRAEC
jgi:hypothetical protein